MIPHSEIQKAIDEQSNHINFLIQKAIKDFNSGELDDICNSIFLSVVAIEEVNKLNVFGDSLRKMKNVSNKQLEKLETHNYKLTKIMKTDAKREEILGRTINLKNWDYALSTLKDLNEIKQLCIYFDYIDGKTVTLKKLYLENEITLSHLRIFTYFLNEFVQFLHFFEILRCTHGDGDGVLLENESLKQTKNYQILLKFADEMTNPLDPNILYINKNMIKEFHYLCIKLRKKFKSATISKI